MYTIDRLNDMIICGDENSAAPEVAKAVSKHHAVRDCAQVTSEEIVRPYHGLMATDKCPRSVELRSDALPCPGPAHS